jgi:glycine/D-amino acid oxidase-like deaminating enzyme
MAEERFDVLVVGGGITGVGVALDAVSRGFSTALVSGAIGVPFWIIPLTTSWTVPSPPAATRKRSPFQGHDRRRSTAAIRAF